MSSFPAPKIRISAIAAAAGDHGGDGSGFGAAAAGIRHVFDIAAGVKPSVTAAYGGADGKVRIRNMGVLPGSGGKFEQFGDIIHFLHISLKMFIN